MVDSYYGRTPYLFPRDPTIVNQSVGHFRSATADELAAPFTRDALVRRYGSAVATCGKSHATAAHPTASAATIHIT